MSVRLHEIRGANPASHAGGSRHPGLEAAVDLSVVIPIFDERDNLTLLHQRLTEVLSGLDRT
jgi:hypothetical protein